MRVLVTGANGLLGNHLCRELLADGYRVRALVRATSNVQGLDSLDVDLVRGDVRDGRALARAAEGCEVLYHTAAVYSYWGYSRKEMVATAREGVTNAVDAAHAAGVGRVVLTSSTVALAPRNDGHPITEESELEDPDDPASRRRIPDYFWTKALQERAARRRALETGVDLVVASPSLFVGPHDHRPSAGLATVTGYLSDPLKLTWDGGCNIVHAADVARGHVLLAQHGKPGERYILATEENWEWSRVHRTLSELAGVRGPGLRMGSGVALAATSLMELAARVTRKPPLGSRDMGRQVGIRFWYDARKARELGFRTRPMYQTLAETLAWVLSHDLLPKRVRSRLRPHPDVEAFRRGEAA